jgi:hypothetical protein
MSCIVCDDWDSPCHKCGTSLRGSSLVEQCAGEDPVATTYIPTGLTVGQMGERADFLRGGKDNMSASTRDLASEQWRMTAELCSRLERGNPAPRAFGAEFDAGVVIAIGAVLSFAIGMAVYFL